MQFLHRLTFFAGALGLAGAMAAAAPAAQGPLPPGGHYDDCYGYIRHVSLENVRVHCVNGKPADVSFLSWPKFVTLPNGKTEQSKDLKPQTPVHVIFSQSLGVRHAHEVYVMKNGHGLYNIKN
jgi:hypothetical protein